MSDARTGPTLAEQIASVSREIRMRESVYASWVQAKKMSQNKSEYELECMRAVLATLQELERKPS